MPEATSSYRLHPQLEADTALVTRLQLCEVRRMNERRYPWLILIPRRHDISEIHELDPADQQQIWTEITATSVQLQAHTAADKMNIAALGNQVPQLHVHIIARFTGDPAWPDPVWGRFPPEPFDPDALVSECSQLSSALADL